MKHRSIRPTATIPPDEAHLWLADPADLADSLAPVTSLLSTEEHARMQRLHFERDRVSYAAARGLARAALTWCAPDVGPRSWKLAQDGSERPEVQAPLMQPRLRFNISHTRGLVACLVTTRVDCGVDVETRRRLADVDVIARRVLSPPELADLMDLPDDLRPARFVRYWTLKEAYAKARGLGLALPFEQITFRLGADGIELDAGSAKDEGTGWQFAQWTPTDRHVVAVAIRPGPGRVMRLVSHTGVPSTNGL